MTTFILRDSGQVIECTEANNNRQQINIGLMDGTWQRVWEMMLGTISIWIFKVKAWVGFIMTYRGLYDKQLGWCFICDKATFIYTGKRMNQCSILLKGCGSISIYLQMQLKESCKHVVLWKCSSECSSVVCCISPHLSSLGPCCGSAGSGSHPWPVSGPSPVWTDPPCHAGCTCSPAAAQGTQRTCTSGHSPTTSPAHKLLAVHQAKQRHSCLWAHNPLKRSVRGGEQLKKRVFV